MAQTQTPGGGAGYQIPTTGRVTPEEIYYLLLGKGLSTAQAIGVMANILAESGFNPESDAVDSNGYRSYGLINWNARSYPAASSLVTGNPQADVRRQIDYLLTSTNGIRAGLAGSSAQQVAGNFAANVENCQGCQPGSNAPNGWSTRVANAAMLMTAATSGNWAHVNASTVATGGGGSGAGGSGGSANCLVKFPGIAGFGSACILNASQARAIVGGLMLAPSLALTITGAVVLAAFAFRRSGAGQAVGGAAQAVGGAIALVPGGQAAGAAVSAAGSVEKRQARAAVQQRANERAEKRAKAREAREGRDYDEVMSRTRDSAKGPAPRPGRELEPAPF